MTEAEKKKAMEFLYSQGFSQNAAAAAVGRMIAESGGNPTAREVLKDGTPGPGYGAFQWTTPSRQQGLEKFARDRPWVDPKSLEGQLLYAAHELDTTEKGAGSKLYSAKDYPTAASAMMDFTRPQGYTAANPSGGLGYSHGYNAGASLVGAQPITGPAIAAAGSGQTVDPQSGLLAAPTGIDAEIAEWSKYGQDPASRAALDRVLAADAAKKASALSAGSSAMAAMGKDMVAAGAPKQRQWENLQANIHQPKELAGLPDLTFGFGQQLAQNRLKRRNPWEET